MDYTRIAELKNIQLSKEIKHDLNKAEQNEYAEEIYKALNEGGLTEDLVYYITSMARYGGIDGFIRWYTKLQNNEQNAAIEVLTSDSVLNKLGVNALRFVLYLLASIISLKPENSIVNAHIFLLLVYCSYKKDGTRINDLGMIFKSNFANVLKPYVSMPMFSKYPFPDNYINELIQMLEEAVNQMPVRKEKEILKRDELRKWVEINKRYSSNNSSDNSDLGKKSPQEESTETETNADSISATSETVNKTEGNQNSDDLSTENIKPEIEFTSVYAKKLFEITNAIALLEKDYHQLQNKAEQRDKTIKSLNMKLKISEEEHIKDSSLIAELEERLNQSKEQLSNALREKTNLEDRISRQASVLEVFQEDKVNSQSQQLNSIAASLSMYYKSYQRVKDEEPQTEMELILMDLLEDIFKKLKKNGIDVQGSIE